MTPPSEKKLVILTVNTERKLGLSAPCARCYPLLYDPQVSWKHLWFI